MNRISQGPPPPVPVTEAEYAELCDCRCSRLRGTHQALHCAELAGGSAK